MKYDWRTNQPIDERLSYRVIHHGKAECYEQEVLAGLLTEEPDGSHTWEAEGPKKFGTLSVRLTQRSGKHFGELRVPKKKLTIEFGPLDEFHDLVIQVENHLLIEYPWSWKIFRAES